MTRGELQMTRVYSVRVRFSILIADKKIRKCFLLCLAILITICHVNFIFFPFFFFLRSGFTSILMVSKINGLAILRTRH